MKNNDQNREIGLFSKSYSSFICVYPVHLRFEFSNFVFKRTALGVSPDLNSAGDF